jgi:hypothetical protein
VILNGDPTKDVLYQAVHSGTKVHLSANGSTDPDGDALQYRWWEYHEAGSDQGTGPGAGPLVSISNASSANAWFTAPEVNSSRDIHIILEVSDDGSPQLTSYRRIVVTVKP